MILDAYDSELRIGRYPQSDADQSGVEQQAVGCPAPAYCGRIDVVIAVGTVIRAENRVEALGREKSELDFASRYGPGLSEAMAGGTRSPVGAQRLEGRSRPIIRCVVDVIGLNEAAWIGYRKETE